MNSEMLPVLPADFYATPDPVAIARNLLGKIIRTEIHGISTAGYISETEAYFGETDRASHSWGGRRTARTETLYGDPGTAYVYLCYGIHHLFNVVTGPPGVPHAVLLRGILPFYGEQDMLLRRKLPKPRKNWVGGPGSASQALGIVTTHNGVPVTGNSPIIIHHSDIYPDDDEVVIGPRIGVDYAGEDALLPYRFLWTPKKIIH